MLEVLLDLCFLIADSELCLFHFSHNRTYHPLCEVGVLHADRGVGRYARIRLPSNERINEIHRTALSLEVFQLKPWTVCQHYLKQRGRFIGTGTALHEFLVCGQFWQSPCGSSVYYCVLWEHCFVPNHLHVFFLTYVERAGTVDLRPLDYRILLE